MNFYAPRAEPRVARGVTRGGARRCGAARLAWRGGPAQLHVPCHHEGYVQLGIHLRCAGRILTYALSAMRDVIA